MGLLEYDLMLEQKIKNWFPSSKNVYVCGGQDYKDLMTKLADDASDTPIHLPMISISRSEDVELLSNVMSEKTFRGVRFKKAEQSSKVLNVIPIKLDYKLDIWAKDYESANRYMREILFMLINNPRLIIDIEYNGESLEHIAYTRIGTTVSDTSNMELRGYKGQFSKWTINIELQDTYLFNVAEKMHWTLKDVELENVPHSSDNSEEIL